LSVSEAYRLLNDWGVHAFDRYDGVAVNSIRLTQYGCSLVSDRRYYVLDFAPVIEGNELRGNENWIAVLMDETIVGPQEF